MVTAVGLPSQPRNTSETNTSSAVIPQARYSKNLFLLIRLTLIYCEFITSSQKTNTLQKFSD